MSCRPAIAVMGITLSFSVAIGIIHSGLRILQLDNRSLVPFSGLLHIDCLINLTDHTSNVLEPVKIKGHLQLVTNPADVLQNSYQHRSAGKESALIINHTLVVFCHCLCCRPLLQSMSKLKLYVKLFPCGPDRSKECSRVLQVFFQPNCRPIYG